MKEKREKSKPPKLSKPMDLRNIDRRFSVLCVHERVRVCGIRNEITGTLAASPDISIPRHNWHGQPIKLYIEHHKSVSVLYADVVNYTYITTQLPVKALVEVLHELFVKFDQASEVNCFRISSFYACGAFTSTNHFLFSQEYNVLRIKFLGDVCIICFLCYIFLIINFNSIFFS